MSLVFLLPLVAAMVWLMIVPQRRQLKQQQQLLRSVEEGDAVVTNAGIYGVITELDDDVIYLEVAEGIELKMSRASIAKKITEPVEATAEGK
jgi:preprotein translocase subunit YajC